MPRKRSSLRRSGTRKGNAMDPVLLLSLTLIVAAIAWSFVQISTLHRRLTSLEKQHLALVAEIEEKIFPN